MKLFVFLIIIIIIIIIITELELYVTNENFISELSYPTILNPYFEY
jgi:hypothetical protein